MIVLSSRKVHKILTIVEEWYIDQQHVEETATNCTVNARWCYSDYPK